MNNKEAMAKLINVREGFSFVTENERRQVCQYFLELAKDYEQAKFWLPSKDVMFEVFKREQEEYIRNPEKNIPRGTDRLFSIFADACLHQVALSRVKFKNKEWNKLKLLDPDSQEYSDQYRKAELTSVILSEMGGE